MAPVLDPTFSNKNFGATKTSAQGFIHPERRRVDPTRLEFHVGGKYRLAVSWAAIVCLLLSCFAFNRLPFSSSPFAVRSHRTHASRMYVCQDAPDCSAPSASSASS